ncbi:MAG: phosphotransferase [Bacteroidales bacterium]|nr:phosphotransferase [Bacteroidales bacterium]
MEAEYRVTDTFRRFLGSSNFTLKPLPLSGSNRRYFRVYYGQQTYIGVFNTDTKENIAFIHISQKLSQLGIPVPSILFDDLSNHVYILNDLGNTTLLDTLQKDENGRLTNESKLYYKKAISFLPKIQLKAAKEIDFSLCYPREAFDRQSILWDLNYFKYYFARLANVPFDEQKIENDFDNLSEYLCRAEHNFFLYRDFQSRNIMILNGEPFFIDYQGGRKGALQYDIASILFEAKTFLHPDDRKELLEFYLGELQKLEPINRNFFLEFYYAYVYIRLMQAMGAYGFRGLYEKKELFLQSIPMALEHLRWLRQHVKLNIELPELEKVWDFLVENESIRQLAKKSLPLLVKITSFSYKRGLPIDNTEHGGGYIFDCRAVTNPGKEDRFTQLTGKDEAVKQFLESETSAQLFFAHVWALISGSIQSYQQRGFNYLSVAFGCTGGQHRSVFFAEKLARHIKQWFPSVRVELYHRELENHNLSL